MLTSALMSSLRFDYQRLIQEGKFASSQDGKVPVYLQLQDETGFPHEGTIDFSDNTFDSITGTRLLRASFPNTDGLLIPGSFVRVRVASSPKYHALLVADRAIGSDQDQSFVYVDGLQEYRPTAPRHDGRARRRIAGGETGTSTGRCSHHQWNY